MSSTRLSAALALLAALAPRSARAESVVIHSYARLLGGEQWRLPTPRGVVRVFAPARYDARSAAIAIYAHGYGTSADRSWEGSHLARQFEASGRNALFVVPDGPQHHGQPLAWPRLGALLAAVATGICAELPRGPLVIVGHSSGFRAVASWLDEPRLRDVVLLDGLSDGQRGTFAAWLARDARRRLVLVAARARHEAERWALAVPRARQLAYVPRYLGELTSEERAAPLLYLRSQYDHSGMVSRERVIPIALQVVARR
jgi:hypothetical protein